MLRAMSFPDGGTATRLQSHRGQFDSICHVIHRRTADGPWVLSTTTGVPAHEISNSLSRVTRIGWISHRSREHRRVPLNTAEKTIAANAHGKDHSVLTTDY
jgi:hypothetical protein